MGRIDVSLGLVGTMYILPENQEDMSSDVHSHTVGMEPNVK